MDALFSVILVIHILVGLAGDWSGADAARQGADMGRRLAVVLG